MPLDAGSTLGKKYGPLKGWQWVAIVGGGGGIVWYIIKARSAATQPATTGLGPAAASPPGGPVVTVISQQGPPSKPLPPAPPGPGRRAQFFNPATWQYFNAHTGTGTKTQYPGPKFLAAGKGSRRVTTLGTIGTGSVRIPIKGAPIYALVKAPGKNYYSWRRIDSAKAYENLAAGTRIGTLPGFV